MQGRLKEICSRFPACNVFADIGCDHGYLAESALRRGLCARAYITDVSAGSLGKAVRLLKPYIDGGKCIPVLCDGMDGIPEKVDFAVIAGLGGEEIVAILARAYLPENFVLQPMHNSDKVRRFLLERGAKIGHDYTFSDGGYFYDLISGSSCGGDSYSEQELLFGRDNLSFPSGAFFEKVRREREKLTCYLARELSQESRKEMEARLRGWEEVALRIGEGT